jgi:hypothetical protein
MENVKDFLSNITRAGWIVVSLVIALIVLVLSGFLLARNDAWPFIASERGVDSREDIADEEFINQAIETTLSVDGVINGQPDNSFEAAEILVQITEPVQVAVVSERDFEGLTVESGVCGNIIYATVRVERKPAILNESLIAMFGDKIATDVMPGNVVPRNNNLLFEKAVIENGEALIFLNGSFSGDECQVQNTINQIKFTALNFSTVNSVAIFLNGQET